MVKVYLKKTRICTHCDVRKNLTDFHLTGSKSGKRYYRYQCIECRLLEKRLYKKRTPAERKEKKQLRDQLQKVYKLNHRNVCRLRSYWPELDALSAIIEYRRLLILQKFCCAICNKHESKQDRRLSIDHDHSSGKVRGLLCNGCNRFVVGSHTVISATILLSYLELYDNESSLSLGAYTYNAVKEVLFDESEIAKA